MDKVVVITGASSGIGAALADSLAKRGAKLVLAARRKDELEAVAKRTSGLAVVADLTKAEDNQRLAREALAKFGRIDVWVNNAGKGITRAVSQLTDSDIDEMMLFNVKLPLYGMQAVLPHFKERNAGQIINVSSVLGRIPLFMPRAAYSGAKHYLNALTTSLRQELQPTHPGIRVTLVSPGVVKTEFGVNALHGGVDSRTIPTGQEVGEVAEIIAGVIEDPRDELYTRPVYKQNVADYYASLG